MDICASVMDNDFAKYSVGALYFVNTVYFVLYVARTAILFLYTLVTTHIKVRPMSKRMEGIFMLPLIMIEILIALSPVTGWIFEIVPGYGYRRGVAYNSIYYLFLYYLLLTLITVLIFRKNLSRTQFISILLYCGLLLCGNFLRFSMPYILIMDAFAQMAIIVIYLSLQNPDYYIEKKTALFDTDAFLAIVGEWMASGKGISCFCFFIDQYDDMRNVYDVTIMNEALWEIGGWLTQNEGENHTFYFGDGRFVAVGKKNESIVRYGECVKERFRNAWNVQGTEVHLAIRTGMLPAYVQERDPVQLLELLHFFFSEKSKDKTRHALIDDALVEQMRRAKSVEKAIERAVNNGTVEVWYQPIYSYRTGRFDTAEALVRIQDEMLGWIMPGEFIPQAERTGQIVSLGREIFRKVCALIQNCDLRESGIEYIHVNLSPIQCLDEGLAEELKDDMEKFGIDSSMIEFEITETAIMETDEFHRTMQQLAELGKGMALDDYGSGATNLNRMFQWHFNMVKIDKEIFAAFFQKQDFAAIADLVKMFHNQNLEVVVEGIETVEMTEMALHAQADFAQGYYYSKPLREDRYLEFLKLHA